MKFQYIFILWLIIIASIAELTTRSVFKVSILGVIAWWITEGSSRLMVIFLVGLCGTLFLIFISKRTSEFYLSIVGKPETYVFTGDKLREGFYGYRDNDELKNEVFIPYFLDANYYPATSFNSLFYRKAVIRNKTEVLSADVLLIGPMIIWTIFTVFLLVLFVAGMLVLFKDYALSIKVIQESDNLNNITAFVLEKTSSKAFYCVLALGLLPLFFIPYIKYKTKDYPEDKKPATILPAKIKDGNIIMGRVVAFEKYNAEPGSDRSVYDARFRKRFLVQFQEDAGFDTPVYIHWDAQDIHDGNLENKSKSLKNEFKLKQDYFGKAFQHLESAQASQSEFPFLIVDDLCILPYLEDKKDSIPELLQYLK